MSQSAERVLRFLTGKENIEVILITNLQQLANEYPFFSVAQFLLAKKLKTENHPDFLLQSQKTVLYFSNPFWLHFQLESEQLQVLSNSNPFTAESQKPDKQESAVIEEEIVETGKPINIKKEFHAEKNADQPEEEMAAITREADITATQFLNEIANLKAVTNNNDNKQNLLESDNFLEEEATEVLGEMAGTSHETEEALENFLNTTQKLPPQNNEQSVNLADNNLFDSDLVKEEKENKEQDEHEKMFQNIKAMLDATSEEAEADTNNVAVHIDPYYTIDYFAAQGIKLDLEQNPGDDLGKHLKKFTQWLKQMKKLGPEDATEVISRGETDADIKTMADSSNTVREVVTEAMASVLEKQGKKEKAIELYTKLSFLNPHKSAYFASQIHNLKGISK